MAAGVRRPGHRPGAGGGDPHRRGPLPHSLHAYFLLGGDPQGADRLRGRPHPRRQQLHHAARRRDPAWQRDLHHVGVVPRRRAGARAPDADADGAAARSSCRATPRSRRKSCRRCPRRCRATTPRPADRAPPGRVRPLRSARRRRPTAFNVWIRTTGPLPDDPAIHRCVLAYASDMTLLDTALLPHGAASSTATSWPRASTTRCGFTGRSAPTSGCSTPRTARALHGARGFARGLIFSRRRHAGRLGRPGRPDARAAALRPAELAANSARRQTASLCPAASICLREKAINPLNLPYDLPISSAVSRPHRPAGFSLSIRSLQRWPTGRCTSHEARHRHHQTLQARRGP